MIDLRQEGRRALALCGAAVTVGIALQQFGVYRAYRDRARSCLASRDMRLEQIRAAARRLDQLRAETERLKSDITRLRLILPERLDVDDLVSYLRDRAAPRVVEVQENSSRPKPREETVVVEVSLTLFGANAAIDGFLSSLPKATRLMSWKETDVGDGYRTGLLTTYARPPKPRSSEPAACTVPDRAPWLWPFSRWGDEFSVRLKAQDGEIRKGRELLLEVAEFEWRKEDLMQLVDVINELKQRVDPEWSPEEGKSPSGKEDEAEP